MSGSRFEKSTADDLLAFLSGAVRRRANPFAVVEAVLELLRRHESPAALGGALVTFHATFAGEVRDALEGHPSPVARFLQALVPLELPDKELEVAWRSAAHTLSKLRQFDRAPPEKAIAQLKALAADEEVLHAVQTALATAVPADVLINRWFVPVLLVDGSEGSLDALLPHVDAALSGNSQVLAMFKPLLRLAASTPALDALVTRLLAGAPPSAPRRRSPPTAKR